jgi:protein-disulfide isomerase
VKKNTGISNFRSLTVVSLFGIALVVGSLLLSRPKADQLPAPPLPVEKVAGLSDSDKLKVDFENLPTLGDPNAPLTIVEFTDFECDYCRQFYQTTLPEIKQAYIDTGQVRIVFKDFPISNIDSHSLEAAVAAQCANDQGEYQSYSELLYANQTSLSAEQLISYAGDLNLDKDKFTKCFQSGEKEQVVAASTREALNIGVTSTPTLIIDGQLHEGALTATQLSSIIDQTFAKVSGN